MLNSQYFGKLKEKKKDSKAKPNKKNEPDKERVIFAVRQHL